MADWKDKLDSSQRQLCLAGRVHVYRGFTGGDFEVVDGKHQPGPLGGNFRTCAVAADESQKARSEAWEVAHGYGGTTRVTTLETLASVPEVEKIEFRGSGMLRIHFKKSYDMQGVWVDAKDSSDSSGRIAADKKK